MGRSVALTLSSAGASLLLVARTEAGLIETQKMLPGPAEILPLDLSECGAAFTVVDKARSLWPCLHGVVNNAAITGPIGFLWQTDALAWEASLRVNLMVPMDLCRHTIPWMMECGSGSIVNISGGGAATPRPRFTAYAAAKSAIVRLTETLAQELSGTGIRCNAVAPGAMNTRMLEAVLLAGLEAAGAEEYGKALQQTEEDSASPERAAALCTFLLSDASARISGRLLSARWDCWTTLPEHVEELGDIYTLRRIVPADRGKDWS